MKKQFTNGEWSTQTPPTIDNKNIRYIAADIGIIAEVRERNDIEISENVANAKLMAAAPKMFKTLEMVFKIGRAHV